MMKRKILIGLTILMLVAAGCTSYPDSERMTEEDYLRGMVKINREWLATQRQLSEFIVYLNESGEQIIDADTNREMLRLYKELREIGQKFKSDLVPPRAYDDDHKLLMDAVKK